MMTQPIPEGSVVITPTDMYKELRDTHDGVRSLGQKFDALVESMAAQVGDQAEQIKDHEGRIRLLEKMVWRAAGAAAVIGAGLSYAVEQFTR